MSDQDNKPSAALEGLLRRWGAETAMREAEVPPAPPFEQAPLQAPDEATGISVVPPADPASARPQVGGAEASAETPGGPVVGPAWASPAAPRPKPGLVLSRWLPVAVAAALLLSSLILFFHSLAKSGTGGQARQELKVVTTQRDQAQKDLQEAVTEVEAAKAELADQKHKHDGLVAKTTKDYGALQETLGEKLTEVAKLKEDAAKAASLLAEMAPRLEAATGEVNDARKLLAYKEKETAELVRDIDAKRKRMAAAQAELDRLISVNEQAARASRKALNEMVLMQARRETLFADARRVYLSVKAVDEAGLHASQMVSRRSGMIAQCSKLRALADADALRILLDKLEVFLTRLDLIDATSYEDAQAFTAMVSTSKILDQIDEVLGMRIDDEYLRTWLFEARLILMGIERAS
ncbi:MAG: hypothetical protein ISS78_01930 [Phycisphaerae bacterium]|nr:hypothetical protein [Phycisphaerae bacterium]